MFDQSVTDHLNGRGPRWRFEEDDDGDWFVMGEGRKVLCRGRIGDDRYESAKALVAVADAAWDVVTGYRWRGLNDPMWPEVQAPSWNRLSALLVSHLIAGQKMPTRRKGVRA